jgi:phosphoglucosamine mutase
MARSGQPLAELAAVMTRFPQVLHNVPVADRNGLGQAAELWQEVKAASAELGSHGRVLVRPSGTEPVVRVMVEAPTSDQAEQIAERLVAAVEAQTGG